MADPRPFVTVLRMINVPWSIKIIQMCLTLMLQSPEIPKIIVFKMKHELILIKLCLPFDPGGSNARNECFL